MNTMAPPGEEAGEETPRLGADHREWCRQKQDGEKPREHASEDRHTAEPRHGQLVHTPLAIRFVQPSIAASNGGDHWRQHQANGRRNGERDERGEKGQAARGIGYGWSGFVEACVGDLKIPCLWGPATH
jgi:hypothetical protein